MATRNHLAVLDPATGAVRAFVPLGGVHLKMAGSPGGRRSYHTLPTHDDQSGALTVVDLAAGEVERTIPIPGMSPLTIGVRPLGQQRRSSGEEAAAEKHQRASSSEQATASNNGPT